jgi:hypothetical protein
VSATGELSDEDLEKVAGGVCTAYCPKIIF